MTLAIDNRTREQAHLKKDIGHPIAQLERDSVHCKHPFARHAIANQWDKGAKSRYRSQSSSRAFQESCALLNIRTTRQGRQRPAPDTDQRAHGLAVIARLFDRGVVLRMGGREIRAHTSQDLRSTLSGHASMNAVRMSELGKFADQELTRHAAELTALASSLSEGLSGLDCDPAQLLAYVHGANAALDETWAAAIAQVSQWPSARSGYQLALLEALLEYLASERDCVRTLIENRRRTPLDTPRATNAESEVMQRQRLIFDVTHDDEASTEPPEFNRLTKGEPLEIAIAAGQCIQLLLAQHRFALVCGSPWRMIDEYGEDLRLSTLRCVVGRSNDCDLVVHDSFRAISRRHVVLETRNEEMLRITDISSLGTFVPRAYLDNRLH